MIYRHLFPPVINVKEKLDNVGILKVNRQIHAEASAVLYEQCHFKASIGGDMILLQNQSWYRRPVRKRSDNDYSIGNVFCMASARRIRHLDVHIDVTRLGRSPHGIGTNGITQEEQGLYEVRDSVRKFAVLLMDPSARYGVNNLRNLKVTPTFHGAWNWDIEEVAIYLNAALEPFQLLHGINRTLEPPRSYMLFPFLPKDTFLAQLLALRSYIKGKEEFTVPYQVGHMTVAQAHEPDAAVKFGFQKIEAFVQLLYRYTMGGMEPWMSKPFFINIERPMHLARVAYENNDIELIRQIQEAIKVRWVNGHRRHKAEAGGVAESVNAMFEGNPPQDIHGNPTSLRELYPDAFCFEDFELIQQNNEPSTSMVRAQHSGSGTQARGSRRDLQGSRAVSRTQAPYLQRWRDVGTFDNSGYV
jgi:hypothetical protein